MRRYFILLAIVTQCTISWAWQNSEYLGIKGEIVKSKKQAVVIKSKKGFMTLQKNSLAGQSTHVGDDVQVWIKKTEIDKVLGDRFK